MLGLMCEVYRSGSQDTTNGGVSEGVDHVVVVSDEFPLPEIFSPRPGMPAMRLEMRDVGFARFPVLVPLDCARDGRQGRYMFGGNFVWTSDSRWPFSGPVKIFDRAEW